MLAGVSAEKSQDTFSFSAAVQQPKVAPGVHKHSYESALPGQGTQTSGINCSVSRRKHNLGHCLPQVCALASLTLSLHLFSRLKHHLLFSLQVQGGQKEGGGSSECCYKVFFVLGIHISDLALRNIIIYLCGNGKGK